MQHSALQTSTQPMSLQRTVSALHDAPAICERGREVVLHRAATVYAVLMGFFVAVVILTNTVGVKLFDIAGQTLPVSILWFPLTFLTTDVVSEIYGARRAQLLVWIGFLASVGLLAAVHVGIALPSSAVYGLNSEYAAVFAPTWRLLLASMTAYLLAQSIDVRLFHWLKSIHGERFLWLRNNASTMVSQLVDSFTVTFIFLWGNEPVFVGTFGDLVMLALRIYVAKVLIAALDTPLCYVVVAMVRRAISARS